VVLLALCLFVGAAPTFLEAFQVWEKGAIEMMRFDVIVTNYMGLIKWEYPFRPVPLKTIQTIFKVFPSISNERGESFEKG
jgi:hypothetical protein